MGTRSLTVFLDEYYDEIAVLYRQYDGYPEGHGLELLLFLHDFEIGNGIPLMDKPQKFANGADCLAAQIVAHFKEEPGNFYLMKATTRNVDEEYIYYIAPSNPIEVYMEDVWREKTYKLELAYDASINPIVVHKEIKNLPWR